VTSTAKEPKNTVKVLTSNAAGKACIVKNKSRRTDGFHPPSQLSEGGRVALRKTDTHTRPVTMNEPKHVCDLARAKEGGWRFATVHPCTAEGQTRNFNYICYIVTIRHLAKKREDQ